MTARNSILDVLRAHVRAFAEAEIAPRLPRMERSRTVDRELPKLLAAQGWTGVTIPAAYGGMDAGHTAAAVIVEELSRVSGAAGAALQAMQLGTAPILHLGSPEQHERWLPLIAAGQMLPTIAVTEPGSGSHVLGMGTTARRRGRWWQLNGGKAHIGDSHAATDHVVVARTGEPGARSLSAFVVPARTTGVALAPHGERLGLVGFAFGEVHLSGVRVPHDHLLGDVGDGLTAAYSTSILYGRPQLGAVALGLHAALLETVIEVASLRRRYGHPLADLPGVADKIGKIEANHRSSRLALYSAVRSLDHGLPCDADLIHANLTATELLLDSVRLAMEIHAAEGLDAHSPVSRILRDSYCLYAPAGTSDIQRLRLAEHALGRDTAHTDWSAQYPGRWAHLHPSIRVGTLPATGPAEQPVPDAGG